MNMGGVTAIALAIVSVAFVFVAVSNTNTAGIIKAFGDAFSGSLKVATGR